MTGSQLRGHKGTPGRQVKYIPPQATPRTFEHLLFAQITHGPTSDHWLPTRCPQQESPFMIQVTHSMNNGGGRSSKHRAYQTGCIVFVTDRACGHDFFFCMCVSAKKEREREQGGVVVYFFFFQKKRKTKKRREIERVHTEKNGRLKKKMAMDEW